MDNKNLICSKSLFFENLLEHRFIADIMMYGWYLYDKEIKVLRPEIDSSGFDIIIDCENIYRYIQLKTSKTSSKRSYQRINNSLLNKKNSCIIWLLYEFNEDKKDLDIRYFFWGSDIGKRHPRLKSNSLIKTTHSITGVKEVTNIRNIPKGHFTEVTYSGLFARLFGIQNENQNKDKKCKKPKTMR